MAQTARVFVLQPYNRQTQIEYIVLTSHPEDVQKVTAAWSYAVRYTAKGLDLPDHEAALAMFKKRHPSWEIIESRTYPVNVNLAVADNDEPETS